MQRYDDLALETEGGGMDEAVVAEGFSDAKAAAEGLSYFMTREWADSACYEEIDEV
jgi:hypothetical protein